MTGIDLKIARIKRGIKQLELARATGIHSTRLSKIENEWSAPTPQELTLIQERLRESDSETERKRLPA